ncbi:hypothetical protein C8C76_1465 [Halanaerobium saccharolyticum]|uniref:Uncharacterized protein n=1 Tax=Halanaerobium saccharolyticum TaxID=43595 RepID=A0A2T5RFS9_9FIRM|nr:peroxidase [Halanaerobium saccharolyticum]PTV93231.1 hypothetical protein C8C76_1465 [Halanaerobium saccharolyticum]
MAWIDMVGEEKVEGKFAKLYDKLTLSGKNELAHVLKVQSLNLDLLADHLKIYQTILSGSSNIC